MWDTNGGVYLGYATDRTEGEPLTRLADEVRYVGDRHIMVIGPNGSGKSRRVLLPNLAQLKDWSIVVVDPKGELAAMCAEHRDPGLRHSWFLNPFGVLGMPSHGHNPVAALDPEHEDFPDDALGLAEAMIRVEGREPHWAASAQDLVCALIMFSRLAHPGGGGLGNVRQMLGRQYEAFRELVGRMIETGYSSCEELATKAGRYADIDAESRELNSILSTALTQTRWLDSRPVRADLGRDSGFDFATLKERPSSVYLILPARRLGTHSTWLRLMIASIIQPLMKDTRKAKVPVLLMLDEYPAIADGGFPVIEKNMAMFRGYGIKLMTVFQDLAQAQRLYGENWESFAANSGVLQAFAPQDLITAKYLSDRTGLALTTLGGRGESRSLAPGRGGTSTATSTNISEQGLPLMLPQALRNMDDGFSVIFSHKIKGVLRSYFPYHVRGLEEVYRRDVG